MSAIDGKCHEDRGHIWFYSPLCLNDLPMLVKWQVLNKYLLSDEYLVDLFNNIKYVIDWGCDCTLDIVLCM